MTVESDHHRAKQAVRVRARELRARAGDPTAAGRALVQHFFAQSALTSLCRDGVVIAGYWPRADEIDSRPLLSALQARGLQVCLPVVVAKSRPLEFRAFGAGGAGELVPGPFDVLEPPAAASSLTPDLLLVPVLAFDGHGMRLGYGGGYYDRTLAALRGGGPVTAIGLAFAGQRMPDLPRGAHDQALDWVVTDAGAQRFDRGGERGGER